MSQSLAQMYLHVVFSTKNRAPLLKGIEEQAHAYLVGACRNLESPSLIIGGVEDHVHILCRQSKNCTFQDEFRKICRKYDLEIDERYVWD